MNYAKQLFKGTSTLFISSILTAILGYFFRVFMARSFSTYEYGLFFSVFALITSIVPFKDLGLAITITRYIPEFIVKKQHQKIKESLYFLLVFQTVVYGTALIIVVLLSKYLALNYFHDESAQLLLIILAIAFFFSTLHSIFNSTNIGFKQIGTYAFFQVAFSAAIIISFHILNFNHVGIASAAWAYLIAYLLTSASQLYFFFRTIPDFFVRAKINKELNKELFSFSNYHFLATTGKNFFFNNGTHILTLLSTMESVAFFNIAMPTANFIRFLFKPVSTMMLQISSEVSALDKNLIIRPLKDMFRYFYIAFVPGVVIAYFASHAIILLLYGEKYIGAALSFSILVFGNLLISVVEMNTNIMLGMKKPKASMITSIILFVTNLVLCIILIPSMNYVGASIAFSTSTVLALAYTLFSLGIVKEIAGEWITYLKVSIGGIALFLFINYLMRPELSLIKLIALFVLSGVLYLFYLVITKSLTMDEIRHNMNKIF